jgi:hypothetical protein
LKDEIVEIFDKFSKQLENNNFENAKQLLIKMKYLTSIEKKIKEKVIQFI